MLPLRYLGVLHTLGLTYREEGLKGLYRGYIAYVLAVSNNVVNSLQTSLIITLVPISAELLMLKTPFYGNYEDSDELYKEVMNKQKQLKQKDSK